MENVHMDILGKYWHIWFDSHHGDNNGGLSSLIDLTPPWYPLFNSHQHTSRSPSSCNQTSQPYFPLFNGHNTVQPKSMGDYLTVLF